jgi:O-acetylhomoserine/O-acetylserine sulfhydrylase-like pyridoxal-dependent enzyme
MTDNAAVASAIAAAPTKLVYAETIANPTTVVADHATIARLAHEHGATYLVDNTFASPYVCRPIELGGRSGHRVGDEVPGRAQ